MAHKTKAYRELIQKKKQQNKMAKKQRNIDSSSPQPKKVSKRSVKKKAKELRSYEAAAKNAAAPINVSEGVEFTEKPTKSKSKTIPQQIAKFEKEGLISKEKPKGGITTVKQTIAGERPENIQKGHQQAIKKAITGSKDGVLNSEAYDAINKEYNNKLTSAGLVESEVMPEGDSPTTVIEENARNEAVINHVPNEEYKVTAEKISVLPQATKAIGEMQATKHEAITRALTEEEQAEQGITTSTGEKVDDLITKNSLVAHQDETYNAMVSGNPAFKAMGENYRKAAKNAAGASSEPAIEALGLQQYYPDINQPIAKGSYSRQTLGSGNIYVGGGGFFPIGVVDARRRALEKEAQAKAKKKQQVMELMFAKSAPQYQDQFYDAGMDMLNKYGEASGWDFGKMMDMDTKLSREFWRESFELQSFGKRSLFLNERVDDILKKAYATDGTYVPPQSIEAGIKWMEGSMNLPEMMKNKKLVQQVERTVQAYDNLTTTSEAIVEVMQKDETLLNINTAEPFDSPEEAAEFADAMKTFQGGNVDDKYWATLKLVGEDRIDAMVEAYFPRRKHYVGGGSSDEIKAAKLDLKKMIVSSISTNVELKTKTLNHGNARQAMARRKEKKEDARTWTTINNRSKNNQAKSGIAGLLNATDDPESRAENLVGGYSTLMGSQGYIDKETGMLYGNVPLQQAQRNAPQDISVGATGVTFKYHFTPIKSKSFDKKYGETVYDVDETRSASPNEIQEYLRNKEQRFWTKQDHAYMNMSSTTVIPNQTMVEARHGFGRRDKDGVVKYVGIDSDAGDAEMSDDYAQLQYSGQYTFDMPVINPTTGKQDKVVWFTDPASGSEVVPVAVKLYDEAQMDKYAKKGWIKGTPTLLTEKTTVDLGNMQLEIPISDPNKRAVVDSDWGTAGKTITTTANQEGEYTENEGTGSTGQNDSEDVTPTPEDVEL